MGKHKKSKVKTSVKSSWKAVGKKAKKALAKKIAKNETVIGPVKTPNEVNDFSMRISLPVMERICNADEEFFENLPNEWGLPKPVKAVNPVNGLHSLFFDNGADILAVAHLDSVSPYKHFGVVNFSGTRRVYSPTLDDRLGCYIIIDMLRRYGLKYDILLTTGEETGQTTAKQFTTDKKYNWLFEFDRTGTDCAMYDYRDKETDALIEKYGWRPSRGSFTDITSMEKLGCKAFNFGTGYHDYHGRYAWASLAEMSWSVLNFLDFYRAMKDTHLPHTEKSYTTYGRSGYYSGHDYGYTYRSKHWSQDSYWDTETRSYKPRVETTNTVAEAVVKLEGTMDEATKEGEKCTECDNINCNGMQYCFYCDKLVHNDPLILPDGMCNDCANVYTAPKIKLQDKCSVKNCTHGNECEGWMVCKGCNENWHGDKTLERTGYCKDCHSGVDPKEGTCNMFCGNDADVRIPLNGRMWYLCTECLKLIDWQDPPTITDEKGV